MKSTVVATVAASFRVFYTRHFVPEHQSPLNVALHVLGTVAGCVLVAWSVARGSPWWLLLWPVVHAAPGLVGHRLTERNTLVGDLRFTRTDFPLPWFIAANHVLTVHLAAAALGLARSPFAARAGSSG